MHSDATAGQLANQTLRSAVVHLARSTQSHTVRPEPPLPLGDCEPVAAGYHHPWRLVHRSRTNDIAAITTTTNASWSTWVRSLTIKFIP
jgi:hypothetical protein